MKFPEYASLKKKHFMKNKEKKGTETTNISLKMYGTKLSGICNQI